MARHPTARGGSARAAGRIALLVAAVVLGASTVGCGIEAGSDDADAPAATPAVPTTTPAAEGPPVVVGQPVVMEQLREGDCFNRYRWDENGRRIEVTTVVPCTGPHDGEVYRYDQYPAPFGTPYPGDDAMRRYAQGACYEAFEAFAGVRYELSELQIGVVTPNQKNFEDRAARYRGITCYVHDPGEVLEGSSRGRGV